MEAQNTKNDHENILNFRKIFKKKKKNDRNEENQPRRKIDTNTLGITWSVIAYIYEWLEINSLYKREITKYIHIQKALTNNEDGVESSHKTQNFNTHKYKEQRIKSLWGTLKLIQSLS